MTSTPSSLTNWRDWPAPAKQRLARKLASRFPADPCAYAAHILRVNWWAKQREIAHLLTVPPYRVLARAAHSVGKTHLAAGLANWFYDTFDPGLVLTTAPTDTQVKDLLWKEIRLQRWEGSDFAGPRASRLESGPDHWAHGFTSRDSDSFQGRHEAKVLIIFDEAVGVAPQFWEAAETMHTHWLCIYNPTDPTSQAYQEEQRGGWHLVQLSALEHPNIAAELAGEPAPFPAAIRLARLQELIPKWCTPVSTPAAGDIEWPPGSGTWWRPGPVAESRLLGRWPSQAVNSVWSEAAWNLAASLVLPESKAMPEIGCDVARFGDDFTSIHGRRGGTSIHHESHNGWAGPQIVGRLKALANELGKTYKVDPKRIPIKIDADGMGGLGVVDWSDGFNFIGVSACTAGESDDYPNLRSQLWFEVADAAAKGRLSLSRLGPTVRAELRRQLLAPTYTLDSRGRRVVEPKDKTKARIKRSPDDADALNLAYFHGPTGNPRPERIRA